MQELDPELFPCSDREDAQEEPYAALYLALEHLTAKQRSVVTRYFGLNDTPTPLVETGRQMAIRTSAAWKLWRAARKRLRMLLGASES
jgi:DNA-directed RNA polymerase specialized sigma24 family protein